MYHSPECLLQLHALFSGFVTLLLQLGLQRLNLWQDGTAQASITLSNQHSLPQFTSAQLRLCLLSLYFLYLLGIRGQVLLNPA